MKGAPVYSQYNQHYKHPKNDHAKRQHFPDDKVSSQYNYQYNKYRVPQMQEQFVGLKVNGLSILTGPTYRSRQTNALFGSQ